MTLEIDIIKKFAKGTKSGLKEGRENERGLLYTRVSSKEQSDNNSLDVQMELCYEFAKKQGLEIVENFGGTYESASKDHERREFTRLLEKVKKLKGKISFILVFKMDRWSRTGASAINIAQELSEKMGVHIISVLDKVDTRTERGKVEGYRQLLNSRMENIDRLDRTIPGMKKKLQRGEWLGVVPKGYQITSQRKKEQVVVFREPDSNFIRQAFQMKANMPSMLNTDIVKQLNAQGFKISKQNLTEIFRNIFYAGYISHNMLDGEIVKGKHPALISLDTFKKVNEIKTNKGYEQSKYNENRPLNKHLFCDDCGATFTGYVQKAIHHYYKCNGCNVNRSANRLHELLYEQLQSFYVSPKLYPMIEEAAINTFKRMNMENTQEATMLKTNITELEKKLLRLEKRFVIEEAFSKELYDKYSLEVKCEIDVLKDRLKDVDKNLSNYQKYIKFSLELCSNLQKMWELGDYFQRQDLLKLLFPEGLHYNRKKDSYRTIKKNSYLLAISHLETEKAFISEGQSAMVDQSPQRSNFLLEDFEKITLFSEG